MNLSPVERRREPRYPIDAKVIVQKADGEAIQGNATDISSSGMKLEVTPPSTFKLREKVTVAVELPGHPGQPFSAWGVGSVVHIDGFHFGIELIAGVFQCQDELLKIGSI